MISGSLCGGRQSQLQYHFKGGTMTVTFSCRTNRIFAEKSGHKISQSRQATAYRILTEKSGHKISQSRQATYRILMEKKWTQDFSKHTGNLPHIDTRILKSYNLPCFDRKKWTKDFSKQKENDFTSDIIRSTNTYLLKAVKLHCPI